MVQTKARRPPNATAFKSTLQEELSRAKDSAARRYKNQHNVVGVSAGTKYTNSLATSDHSSIHFYVKKKVPRTRCKGNLLPKFVYGRFKNGKINRKIKFITDVIEVGHVKTVCGSGSAISGSIGVTRQNGRITIAFRNKADTDDNFYVLSCAHVIGDIDGESHVAPTLKSECSPNIIPFGTTIFSSAQQDSVVDYDVAIARVNSECLPLPDLEIIVNNQIITSFMLTNQITPSLAVECALPLSKANTGVVSSESGSIAVEYKNAVYDVENAWMLKASRRVKEGDSGGLLFRGNAAVGFIFASSESDDGWAWFHPLNDAFEYVRQKTKVKLECF